MGKIGKVQTNCPHAKHKVTVTVMRRDAAPVLLQNFSVNVDGKRPSDNNGVAEFPAVKHGIYNIVVKPPSDRSKWFPSHDAVNVTVVDKDEVATVWFDAVHNKVTPIIAKEEAYVWRDPEAVDVVRPVTWLRVSLTEDHPELKYAENGKLHRSSADVEVFRDEKCTVPLAFDGAGNAVITNAELKGKKPLELYARSAHPGTAGAAVTFTLSLDEPADAFLKTVTDRDPAATETLTVKDMNVVTPKVELEYLVVLVDRNNASHQKKTDTKHPPEPTRVKVWAEQTDAANAYTGDIVLKTTAALVDLFNEPACTTKFDSKALNADIVSATGKLVHARGTKAGLFQWTAELTDSKQKFIKRKKKAEVDAGAVEIKLEVYKYDTKANPPVQNVVLSDKDKIAKGRTIHVQIGANHYRAKVVIKQIDTAKWPAGCDAYTIAPFEENTSGTMALFTTEAGAVATAPLTVATLGAGDQEFWVEGTTETDDFREAYLGLVLDRPGDTVAHTPKKWADFAQFTVVKIDQIHPKHLFAAPPATYTAGNYNRHINLKLDNEGRDIKIKTKLSKALKGVKLHFMLVADQHNKTVTNWGVALPGSWTWANISSKLKHKDKKNESDYLHYSKETDAQGEAEMEVRLSHFGGDKFRAAIYLHDEPLFGGFIDGHVTLGVKAPVQSPNINVYRRLWFQRTIPNTGPANGAPNPAAAVGSMGQVKIDLVQTADVTYTAGNAPANTFYPATMFATAAAAGQVSVMGSHNWKKMRGKLVSNANEPLKAHLILCDYQFDKGRPVLINEQIDASPSADIAVGEPVIDPPLQGGNVVVSGEWRQGALKGKLTSANIVFPVPRVNKSLEHIRVQLPATAPVPTPAAPVDVKITLKAADGPYLGESSKQDILIVFDASNVPDYNDTVAHEIGHSINQTPFPGKQPNTIPDHPSYTVGQGVHCADTTCIMYERTHAAALHVYCDTCKPYLLVEDLRKWR